MNMIKYIRKLVANETPKARATAIITLLKAYDIKVSYNDKLKSGGRSLKIYNRGAKKAKINKVKKLLANKKNIVIKNWTHPQYNTFGVIRIHVK